MEFTRRYWATGAVAAVLATWGLVLRQPIVVLGGAGVMAWLLGQQYRFLRMAQATESALTVTQDIDRPRVAAEERTMGTLTVTAEGRCPLATTVTLDPPVGSDIAAVGCTVAPGQQEMTQRFEAAWPVAGTFEFGRPAVRFEDPRGLFAQRTRVGETATVTVEAETPDQIHVGEGGDRVRAGFGEHETDATGAGFTPAEVRKYLSGDSFRRIDWKATARLNEPHVREFESETDVETALVVDHRASMADGEPGRRKIEFAREVALGLLQRAQADRDPIRVHLVGDEGTTREYNLGTNEERTRAVADHLRTLQPTGTTTTAPAERMAAAQAQQTAGRLDGDTAFETQLRPFFGAATNYVRRVADEPLFTSIKRIGAQRSGLVRTLIVTDDQHRTELLEAVKLARAEQGRVAVFITPNVLYRPLAADDIETAYRDYTEFESFRQELAALPRVDAFEVGPTDRLHTVLASGRQQRRQTQ